MATRYLLILASLGFHLSFFSFCQGARLPETIIRIGILEGVESVNISGEDSFEAVDMISGTKVKLDNKVYTVTTSGNGIKLGDRVFGSVVRLNSLSEGKMLRVNGRRYRDAIKILLSDKGKLNVINELGVEGYLYGVMAREVSPEWPLEALKAQAVVSRTYVMKHLGKHEKQGFDLSATVTSQVYGGVEAEDPRAQEAVDMTRGEVITYNGELIKSFFHSNCGGHTEDVSKVWEGEEQVPYLKGRVCRFCKDSYQYYWERTLSKEEIRERLRMNGYDLGRISKLKIIERTSSGRVSLLKIYHAEGNLEISGNRYRMLMDPSVIRSTLFGTEDLGSSVKFYGRGWGHGVGMCQWGAKGMAERGATYKQILNFYYPGTKIEKWEH